jgi:RNA polymerase sigma-70 factor (ECF subfamily)
VSGSEAVARTVLARGSRFARFARPAIVNGGAGVIIMPGGKPIAVVGFTVAAGRIVEIDLVANPEKLARLELS